MSPTFRSLAAVLCFGTALTTQAMSLHAATPASSQHVLIISIDGLHAVDLARYVKENPASAMAKLTSMGTTYTNASTAVPSDSLTSVVSMMTGGTPRTTGIYYPEFYARNLAPAGSDCSALGAHVILDESVDADPNAVDGGASKNGGSPIDVAKLPRDPAKKCAPVYPHDEVRVNTVFEVVKSHGMRTAWMDKHPAYEVINGPSGTGVDDLYLPEIHGIEVTLPATMAYDDTKTEALKNEIRGFDHTGKSKVGVPALFGLNIQALNIAQKLPEGGYLDSNATPGPLIAEALKHTDASLQTVLDTLKSENLTDTTTIILTAKHGQMPIARSELKTVSTSLLKGLIGDKMGANIQDDVMLVWLKDQSETESVAKLMRAHPELGVGQILYGDALASVVGDARTDPTAPDIIGLVNHGTVYAGKSMTTRGADHGGFSVEDTNVALLVAQPHAQARTISSPASLVQLAPSALKLLGIDPNELQAVKAESTQILPSL